MISSFVSVCFSRRFAGLLSIIYLLFSIVISQTVYGIRGKMPWPTIVDILPSVGLSRTMILLMLVYKYII